MRSLSILVFSLFSSTISSAPSSVRSPAVYSSAASLPFTFTPAFTAKIKLGSPSHPISVPGGVLVNQATTGGTVTGSVLNATIQGGFAHPSDIKDEGERGNVTVQLPTIDIYGKTDDGEDLYLHEVGIGSPEGQVTRIMINISGKKYAPLRDAFVLATVTPNKELTEVSVEGFLVHSHVA